MANLCKYLGESLKICDLLNFDGNGWNATTMINFFGNQVVKQVLSMVVPIYGS